MRRGGLPVAGAVAGAVAVVALLAGCSSSESYDREDFISTLEEGGVPNDQATCIADGVEGRIDLEALEDQEELTAEQQAALSQITQECLSGSSSTTSSGIEPEPETGVGGNDG